MEYQLANVTKDRPDLFPLLEKAYYEIYLPAFPDLNEQETLEKFHDLMNGALPEVGIIINLVGTNLDDPKKAVVAGIGIANYYRNGGTGLLAYNAVHPDHKGGGIGNLLVRSRIEALKTMAQADGKKLTAVFLEANNPVTARDKQDSMDPQERLKLFKKWGAQIVPVDYVQPPLSDYGDYCHDLLLLNYALDGKYAGPKEVRSYLKAIFKENLNGGSEHDSYLKTMLKQVNSWEFPKNAEKPAKKKAGQNTGINFI